MHRTRLARGALSLVHLTPKCFGTKKAAMKMAIKQKIMKSTNKELLDFIMFLESPSF